MANDYPPMSPIGSEYPPMSAAAARQRAQATLDECQSVRDDIVQKIRESIVQCLSECESVSQRCSDCYSGRIQIVLDKAQSVRDKCVQKIHARIRDTLGEAYNYAMPYVGEPPSVEDLVMWLNGGMRPTQQIQQPAEGVPLGGIETTIPAAVSAAPVADIPQDKQTVDSRMLPLPPIGAPVCFDLLGYPIPCPTFPAPSGPPVIEPQQPQPPALSPEQSPTQPHPQPIKPGCSFIMPTCQPGYTYTLSEDGFTATCVENAPTCPAPSRPCPEGQEWSFDPVLNAYKCVPKPQQASGAPKPPTDIVPGGIWSIAGLFDWNKCECPDFGEIQQGYSTLQTSKDAVNLAINRGAFQIEKAMQVPGSGVWVDIVNMIDHAVVQGTAELIKQTWGVAIDQLGNYTHCNYLPLIVPWIERSLLGFIEHWTGVGLGEIILGLTHAVDYYCPQGLPGQGDIDSAYLASTIDRPTWRCWTRADDNMDNPAWCVLQAKRSQPSIVDWIHASWRKLIDPATLPLHLRQQGVLQGDEATVYTELQRPIPHLAESIRYMADSIGNPGYVQRYGLDTIQNAQLPQTIQNWIDATGVEQNTFIYSWRAHWKSIALPQLAAMTWRFRADSLNPTWQQLELDNDDVSYVQSCNSFPDFWAERLREVSRPTISIRHLQTLVRFSNWGTIELVDALRTDGYTERDANTISSGLLSHVRFEKFRELSVLSPQTIGHAYAAGDVGIDEVYAMFDDIGYTRADANATIRQAQWLRTIDLRKEFTSAVKTRFSAGEFTKDIAIEQLIELGIPGDEALAKVASWVAKSDAKGKEFVPSELCQLFDNQLIDGNEYLKRLERLGWNTADAMKHITLCGIRISKRAADQAAKNKPRVRGPRLLQVSELCTMYAQGLLDDAQYHEHMSRLNFTLEDSEKLIQSCKIKLGGKNGKP